MMTKTPNLQFNLVDVHQGQKEITINQALVKMESLINNCALSRNISVPPKDPNIGDLYIIPQSGINEWEYHRGKLAYFYSHWDYINPKEGLRLWIKDEKKHLTYTNNEFIEI